MKQKTGKKIGKILLLVVLLAMVGGIVYTVLNVHKRVVSASLCSAISISSAMSPETQRSS